MLPQAAQRTGRCNHGFEAYLLLVVVPGKQVDSRLDIKMVPPIF
jgi:hypothetical protein